MSKKNQSFIITLEYTLRFRMSIIIYIILDSRYKKIEHKKRGE